MVGFIFYMGISMNLNEIRQRIFDQMDFNPNLQQYRDSVVRRINDHYLQICDSAHWLFLQKETTIQLRKEIEGSATVTIRVETSNLRKVTITGGTFSSEMTGQTFINTNTDKLERNDKCLVCSLVPREITLLNSDTLESFTKRYAILA